MANNVDEFGQTLRAAIGQDVSTNIGLTFTIEPQAGKKVERDQSEGVTVGTVDVVEGDTEYLANQYLEYVVKDGDLHTSGRWRKKAAAKLSQNEEVIGNYERFTVLP